MDKYDPWIKLSLFIFMNNFINKILKYHCKHFPRENFQSENTGWVISQQVEHLPCAYPAT